MIVQELREIQERCGYLPHHEMRELAQRLQVPLHRLHEVASFYPLYRLEPPPKVDVKVCRDMACHLAGAPKLQKALEACAHEVGGEIAVGGVSCLGQCDRPVACTVNDHHVYRGASEAEMRNYIQTAADGGQLPHQHVDSSPQGWKIDPYNGSPRYDVLRDFVKEIKSNPSPEHRKWVADELLKKMEAAGLKGMGGAGFPTHKKWTAVRGAPGTPKYVVCNADESEPGTFKDRDLMRRTPYLVIEGMVLAGLIVGAERGYLYIRHEFVDEIDTLEVALKEARREGLIGDNVLGSGASFPLELFVSPGGYVQGEESALLEAIEDRRGEPRNKPPFPVFNGLFNKPTVINNVETLSWVPAIATHGGEWYRGQGVNGATGLRFVSISGDVNRSGVYEVPFGQTVRDLVMGLAGGISGGRRLKAIAPSGPSGGFLPLEPRRENLPAAFVQQKMAAGQPSYNILDLPLDSATLGLIGSMLGAAFVVYDETRDMVEQALNCTQFFRNESCGKCVPCRVGSQKLVDITTELMARKADPSRLGLVSELSDTMILTSICGLGQVASNPLASVLRHFRPEAERYLADGRRPAAAPQPVRV
jgi:NADH:ubiquinone oxidoreductase subunit F (NADH-binding)/NADH:ubiquinone oxidoreductase subunit E